MERCKTALELKNWEASRGRGGCARDLNLYFKNLYNLETKKYITVNMCCF